MSVLSLTKEKLITIVGKIETNQYLTNEELLEDMKSVMDLSKDAVASVNIDNKDINAEKTDSPVEKNINEEQKQEKTDLEVNSDGKQVDKKPTPKIHKKQGIVQTVRDNPTKSDPNKYVRNFTILNEETGYSDKGAVFINKAELETTGVQVGNYLELDCVMKNRPFTVEENGMEKEVPSWNMENIQITKVITPEAELSKDMEMDVI